MSLQAQDGDELRLLIQQDFNLADCQSTWGLAPKHTNPVGLRVGTNLELSWQVSINQQQEILLK